MPFLVTRFINSADLVAKLIDIGERGYLCHAEGLSRDKKGWVGAHAGTGVEKRPLDWCKDLTLELVYAFPVSNSTYEFSMAYQEKSIGLPYNYADILGMAVFDPNINDNHAVECAQFELARYMAGGIRPLNLLPQFTYKIDPDKLHLSNLWIGRMVTLEQALAL